ncbi:MAG: hypothetical protein ACODAD_14810 [Planctomycetota bacterium]
MFVNNRQSLSVRVYPERRDSLGVSPRAQGQDAQLTSLEAWQLRSIYHENSPHGSY